MQGLMNYQSRKEEIRKRLKETAENFVYIGYQLKQVLENREYEQDGYIDIVEFARKEYSLSKDDTYRFMRINTRFSVEGNTPELDIRYSRIAQTKLSEMLSLPENDLELITPETTREDIRELNRFNKQLAPEEEQAAGPLPEIIKEFFSPVRPGSHQKLQHLLDIVTGKNTDEVMTKEEQIQLCINPNGNGTFRHGRYFLFLYEAKDGIKYKVFGDNENHPVSYIEFANMAHLFFVVANPVKDGMDEWESYYGIEEPELKSEPKPDPEPKSDSEPKPKPEPKSDPKPKEKSEEKSELETELKPTVKKGEFKPVWNSTHTQKQELEEQQEPVNKKTEKTLQSESYPQKNIENNPIAPAQLQKTETQEGRENTEEITEGAAIIETNHPNVVEDESYQLKKEMNQIIQRLQAKILVGEWKEARKSTARMDRILEHLEEKEETGIEGQRTIEEYVQEVEGNG